MRGGTPLGGSVSPFITRPLSCNYACVTAQFAMKSHKKRGPGSSSCGPLDSGLHLLWKIWALEHHLEGQTEEQHAALRHSEVAGSQYRDWHSFPPSLSPRPSCFIHSRLGFPAPNNPDSLLDLIAFPSRSKKKRQWLCLIFFFTYSRWLNF